MVAQVEDVAAVVARWGPAGLCYAASEAAYRILMGKHGEWKPECVAMPGESEKHWYLRHRTSGAILDLTAAQYPDRSPQYHLGVGRGFLPTEAGISRRGMAVLRAAEQHAEDERA